MSKSKIYEISYKYDSGDILKLWVDAPNKRIAKWCGVNLFNHQYVVFLTENDVKVKRYRVEGFET